MKLEYIITLASPAVAHRFCVMERSLRALGCNLPLLVIPYNDERFPLPPQASWWEHKELLSWLAQHGAHPMMRKYQCLLMANYHFVDSDLVFLQNPEEVLQAHSGFVTCCEHWKNTDHAFTSELLLLLQKQYQKPQERAFNAGQFACDRILYSFAELQTMAQAHREITLDFPHHDQPGFNLLVGLHKTPYTNLTLPPFSLASSWAGDYLLAHDVSWPNNNAPYLLHWAGLPMQGEEPVQKLWKQYLDKNEEEGFAKAEQQQRETRAFRLAKRISRLAKRFFSRY